MSPELEDRLRSIGFSAAERKGFENLLNEAIRHRRQHWEKLSQADQEAWVLEMADLVHECGLQRVALGMGRAWTWIPFLAWASDVRPHLPPPPDVPKPRVEHDPNCPDCHGNGHFEVETQTAMWQGKPISVMELYGKPTMRVAQRCYCQRPATPARKKPEGVKEPIPFVRTEFA